MQRVLIVDDDTELSAMLCEYLARENFAVEASDDGFGGARRALSGDFDIAVLDVAMPTRSGLDTLREIRASSALPVLMLTSTRSSASNSAPTTTCPSPARRVS
jgi:two-component system, OmpR family, response regulator